MRIVRLVSALALAGLIVGALLQQPPAGLHIIPFALPGGVPTTLYYRDPPGTPPGGRPGIDRPASPDGFRAGVVVAHGFAGDRHTMEALSRSLALAGYTVVSLDMSGHGTNRNPLTSALAASDQLIGDIRAGVDYLRDVQGIGPERIAVLGHSMGARATIDFGERIGGVGALIMLAGATDLPGPLPPRNALFLYAERDLPGIPQSVIRVASALAGVTRIEEQRTYGDFTAGTAVRAVQIPGTIHGTLVNSPAAYAELLSWLDQATGFPARGSTPVLVTSALGSGLLWFAFLLVLPGLGSWLAALAPPAPGVGSGPKWWPDISLLPVALLLPLPFIAPGRPGVLAGASTADQNVSHLALAGVVLVAGLLLARRFRPATTHLAGALALVIPGWLAVSAMLAPASAWFHGVGLTPGRAVLMVWAAICLAPLCLGTQWLLYRPQWWRGTLLRLGARALVLAAVAVGNALGAFGFPGTIAVFVLIAALTILEPLLAGFYARSANVTVAAGLDALITGWLFAIYLPTTG